MTSCRNFFHSHMGSNWAGFHTRELIATNECLASFKHTHKYVTNYDFDEFIFPRKFVPTRNLDEIARYISSCPKNSQPENNLTSVKTLNISTTRYSLYEYVTDLMTKYAERRGTKKIAWFHFEHMLFFDRVPNEFIANLERVYSMNATFPLFLRFKYDKFMLQLRYESERDSDLARSVLDTQRDIQCINSSQETTARQFVLHDKFNRVYGIWRDIRSGKSVFNTDYVELVNQHYGERKNDQEAIDIKVPLDEGFASHYRESIDGQFFGFTKPFSDYFRVDIEAFAFLYSIFKDE